MNMKKSANANILRAGPSQKVGESRGTPVSSPVYTEGATFATTLKGRLERVEEEKDREEKGRLAGTVSTLSESDGSMETVASSTRSKTGKTGRMTTRSPASSRASSRGFLSAEEDSEEEDSDQGWSDMSMSDAAGPSSRASGGLKIRLKRRVTEEVVRPGDDDSSASPAKMTTAKRGRGRPPTTGHYVGLAKAKEEANKMRREEIRLEAEADLATEMRWRREERARLTSFLPKDGRMTGDSDLVTIEGVVANSCATIIAVATKSGNVKGDLIRDVKDAALAIRSAFNIVKTRTVSEEVAKLMEANKALQEANKALSAKLEDLSRELAFRSAKAPAPTQASAAVDEEGLERRLAERIGKLVSARLEGLEVSGRLLPEKSMRPPLAADRRREAAVVAEAVADAPSPPPPMEVVPPCAPVSMGARGKKGKKAKKREKKRKKREERGKGKRIPAPNPDPEPCAPAGPAPRPQAPQEGQWSEVVKRGSAKKKGVRLRPPRTAAVVLTLQPAAEERGLTYYKVIGEAVSKISLHSLGIPPIKMRAAATGARVIEVDGAERCEKANLLASKLREVFAKEEGVVVSRPEITADLRVTGLDDSIDNERLIAALANAGGCPTSAINAGAIRRGPAGMGAAFVRCPKMAAKRIVAGGGRLLVGWSAARVMVLQPRPRRCFRCLELGHIAAQCEAEVDRSGECYRCGQNGHKAATCSAAPRCSLCAAAGKSADHIAGGKACARPPVRKRTRGRKRAPPPAGP